MFHPAYVEEHVLGPDAERRDAGSLASSGDPDGIGWLLQEEQPWDPSG